MTDLKEIKTLFYSLLEQNKMLREENETMREAVKTSELMRCQRKPTREELWKEEFQEIMKSKTLKLLEAFSPWHSGNNNVSGALGHRFAPWPGTGC